MARLYLSGSADKAVPPELAQAFVAAYPPGAPVRLEVLPGFDHQCCWAEHWPALWQRSRP